MTYKPLTAALVATGVLAGGTAAAFALPQWLKADNHTQTATAQPISSTQVADSKPVPRLSRDNGAPDFRAIVRQSGPAVVGITVEGSHKASLETQGLPPGMENDPFFQFFRGMPGMQNPRGQGRQPQLPFRGLGSGFIISADGMILTNAHVVRDAKEVMVKLSDRREFSAKVLGTDPVTDVAVLKIEASNLPVVRLGNPEQIEVGDPVLAIGSPFGFEQSATQGIVSAKGRSLPGDAAVPFIQTDAAINPGNSGGPLFDGDGSVIGINAQIYSQSGGYQGLSFAIPINVALNIKDQIVKTGSAHHARLGVQIQDLDQALAASFGLPRPDGALVSQVTANSAAGKAGLKAGDVITEIDGKPVVRSGVLSSQIGMSAPGDQVRLKVWRDKSWHDLDVTLGSADESTKLAGASADAASGNQLGLALRPLTAEERRQVDIAKTDQGLLIEDVSGAAEKAGVQAGDVLLAVNGRSVESIEQVRDSLKGKPKQIALLVMRDGNRIFVPVRLS